MREEWYPGKLVYTTEYLRVLAEFEALEKRLVVLKEIELLGTQYFPKLLSYPICIAKELLKWAIKTLRTNDAKQLEWLVDNPHIQEEISVLQKVLAELKDDLQSAKARGEL